jgi:hypothetical protein
MDACGSSWVLVVYSDSFIAGLSIHFRLEIKACIPLSFFFLLSSHWQDIFPWSEIR